MKSHKLEDFLTVAPRNTDLADPHEIGRWCVEKGDEVAPRLSAISRLHELLVPSVEFDEISELMLNRYNFLIAGYRTWHPRNKEFFVENSARSEKLLRGISQNPEPTGNQVTEWVNAARELGLKDRSHAGVVVSVFLSAINPADFIDYKQQRTEKFARHFDLESFNATTKPYGQRIIDAGRMAKEFVEKYPFDEYFGSLPNPIVVVGGLAQLLNSYPLELEEGQTFWRVDVRYGPKENWEERWKECVSRGNLLFGWDALDDLSKLTDDKGKIQEPELTSHIDSFDFSQNTNSVVVQAERFFEEMSEGDLVLAHRWQSMSETRLLGLGRVTGDYVYEPEAGSASHVRPVRWNFVGEWPWASEVRHFGHLGNGSILESSPEDEPEEFAFLKEGLERTLGLDIVEFEGDLPPVEVAIPDGGQPKDSEDEQSMKNPKRITRQLRRSPNLVLQGPPGTGKTYGAQRFIAELVNASDENIDLSEQTEWQDRLRDFRIERDHQPSSGDDQEGLDHEKAPVVWDIVQMHPEYSYEDFVCGLRTDPDAAEGGIHFEFQPGILLEMAELAEGRLDDAPADLPEEFEGTEEQAELLKKRPVVLILDEINRCNLAAVLGELILALEPDKRTRRIDGEDDLKEGVGVRLQYDDNRDVPDDEEPYNELTLPENLFIIGTMNTADRSIAMVDYAIRRRFRFLDFQPKTEVLDNFYDNGPASELAKAVMNRVNGMIAESRLEVGHSYFMAERPDLEREELERQLKDILRHEVGPLLREYAYEGQLENSAQVKGLTDGQGLADWAKAVVNAVTDSEGDEGE